MTFVDKALSAFTWDERETFVAYLRDVVGSPSIGGYGQYLGSLAPLVFATDDQKLEALRLMSAQQEPAP